MAQETPDGLEKIVHANDKLLKAFLALMAYKDEHLLSELRIVFAAAAVGQAQTGEADDPAIAQARRELIHIGEIVKRLEESQAAGVSLQDTH
jgi:hypothetical protein